jgi:PIN domain nuclease of toxin-antitoxin system
MSEAAQTGTVLLDTHCWLWMQFGLWKEFSKSGVKLIEEASRKGTLLVSVMSAWEVGMLESKGRIRLFMPCGEWIHTALNAPGVSLAPLTPEIALESSRLPGSLHGDPVDRILAATARLTNATLLTRDANLLAYGKRKHMHVMSP